jgi:glucose-1-phosphate thymidylyltransferase
MDAVVLAGGYATRLWPITKDRPKMFLPVGETTIVDTIFADLEADDRIDTVYVSTNAEFAPEFESYLADSEFTKPTLSVEETTGEDEKFGVVAALAQLVEREGVEDDLLVVAGDNIIGFDLSAFVDFFEDSGHPSLVAYDVGSRERVRSYAAVELDGDRVTDFEEKPDDPGTTLASICCYAFPADRLGALETYLEDGNNPDEPGWFMQWLSEREAVDAYTVDGHWFDVGEADAYLDAVAWELEGDTLVAPSATVEDATLGENVHVMAGATVRDAKLERSIVFPNATVENATVENSLVDEEAHVDGLDLHRSLVGAHSTITGD